MTTCHNCGKNQTASRNTCVRCGEKLGNLDTAVLGLLKAVLLPVWMVSEPVLGPIINRVVRPLLDRAIFPLFRYLLLPLYALGTLNWALSNALTGLSAGKPFTIMMNSLAMATALLAVIVYLKVPSPIKSALE